MHGLSFGLSFSDILGEWMLADPRGREEMLELQGFHSVASASSESPGNKTVFLNSSSLNFVQITAFLVGRNKLGSE